MEAAMIGGLIKPFTLNEFGHRRFLWSHYVKGDVERRRSYANWLERRRPDWSNRREAFEAMDAEPAFDLVGDDGVTKALPGAISGTDAAVETINRLKMQTVVDPKKPFLSTMTLSPADLQDNPALLAFGVNPGVIAGIARYMGCLPILHYVEIWISSATDGEMASSQFLHCDADDQRNSSLFLYASDVDEKSGPVTAIRGAPSDRIRNGVKYRYGGKGYRVADADAERFMAPDSEVRLTGPKGTLAVVDTARCFHQGSRVEADGTPRVVAIFRYLTPNGFFWPAKDGFRNTAQYRGLATADHAPIQRMALGAE
jgi:hypothetical protein